MVPFLYLAIKSLYWSKGQMMDSLEDKEFPKLSQEVQRTIFFEFGSVEEHYKYRDAVKKAYPYRKVDENS